ncbi:MAG: alkaline phosphatase [Lentisphaeria bacterium]|nr:alkaline phosphatase [Lentisphaeria bacterium]
MKRLLTVIFIVLAAITFSVNAGNGKAPKYIFLFIGDGMASPQRMVADEFARHAGHDRLVINKMPFHGTTRTGSISSLVTDSAASGTAIACGEKTYNGSIGIAKDGKRHLVSVAEVAKKKGMKVGIITTVTINHATPAAFYAHRTNRGQYYEIGLDLVASGFDFFAGSGVTRSNNKKSKLYKGDINDLAKKAGYTVLGRKDDFSVLRAKKGKVLINAPLPYDIDRHNDDPFTLAKFTEMGIDFLDNEKGFFMMVEGGKIDYAGHANDAAANLREVLAFDDAVRVAVNFAKKHPDETLIVVTGDHETGGMTMGFAATGYAMYMERLAHQKCSAGEFNNKLKAAMKENKNFSFEDAKLLLTKYFGFRFDGKDKDPMQINSKELKQLSDAFKKGKLPHAARLVMAAKAGIGWSTGAHTALPVLTTAQGKCAEKFSGFYENTEISNRLKALLK